MHVYYLSCVSMCMCSDIAGCHHAVGAVPALEGTVCVELKGRSGKVMTAELTREDT